MDTLTLQICTMNEIVFDQPIKHVTLRTVVGDVCIMNHHANYLTAIDTGKIRITTDQQHLEATLSQGFLTVNDNQVRIFATDWETLNNKQP